MKVRYWLPDFLVPTVLLSPLIMDATACACKATWQRPGHRWQARTAGLGHSPTPPSSLCPAWSGPCGPCPVSCAPVPPGAPGAPSVPGVGDLAPGTRLLATCPDWPWEPWQSIVSPRLGPGHLEAPVGHAQQLGLLWPRSPAPGFGTGGAGCTGGTVGTDGTGYSGG